MKEPFTKRLRITDETREALRSLVGTEQGLLYAKNLDVRWPSVQAPYVALSLGRGGGFVVVTSETHETPAGVTYGRINARLEQTPPGLEKVEYGFPHGSLSSDIGGEPSTVSIRSGGRPITTVSVHEEAIMHPPYPDFGPEDVRMDSVLIFAAGGAESFSIRVGPFLHAVVEFYDDWRLVAETGLLHEVETIPSRENWSSWRLPGGAATPPVP